MFILFFSYRICYWVDTKNLKLFHGMLLHSSVAMETHFTQLRSYLENRMAAITMHSNLILFDSQ